MSINPIKLEGNWDDGYALNKHVLSSMPLGEDVYGHMHYDTKRSEIGELLYYFKYKNVYDNLYKIIELSKPFLDSWKVLKKVDIILPVPPSKTRDYQPAIEIANGIAKYLNISYTDQILLKTNSIQSKNLSLEEKESLSGSIIATQKANKEHNILLVDDLYRSGKTLRECVNALRDDEKLKSVYVLTITKTKR